MAFTVQFTNTSIARPDAVYDWDFGDGSAHSSEFEPLHLYTGTTHYYVTLTVTDSDGSDTYTMEVYPAEFPMPVADFDIIEGDGFSAFQGPNQQAAYRVTLTVQDKQGRWSPETAKMVYGNPMVYTYTRFKDKSKPLENLVNWVWRYGD